MNNCGENFSTPVQTKTKRLGLRRNNSSAKSGSGLKKTATTATLINGGSANEATNETAAKLQQAQSDVKVDYRSLQKSNKNSQHKYEVNGTPETPTSSHLLQKQAVSTNCRPYRLSLSKRVREKMTKKRLEFHLANEIEKEEDERKICQQYDMDNVRITSLEPPTSVFSPPRMNGIEKEEQMEIFQDETAESPVTAKSQSQKTASGMIGAGQYAVTNFSSGNPAEMSRDNLLQQIEVLSKDLNFRQEHARKTQELKEAIQVWQSGFSSALSDLQDKIVPRVDKETLLDQLHIPRDMLKYVKD